MFLKSSTGGKGDSNGVVHCNGNLQDVTLCIIISSTEKWIQIIQAYDICRAEVFQIVHTIIPN